MGNNSRHDQPRVRLRTVGTLLVLLLASLQAASAWAQDKASASDVEAAYLINVLRYTQWPASRFASRDAPLVVTVVGPAEAAERVRAVAAAAGPIDGRRVQVNSLPASRGSLDAPLGSERDQQAARVLRDSHLVFFLADGDDVHPQVLTDLWGRPVLTVGHGRAFTRRGGMLGLFRNGERIAFDANAGAIRNAGLVVSAKVLKLARTTR